MGTHDLDRLIWIDLEMTGLKTDTDFIIEIATIVTDRDLQTLAEGPVLAIHRPDAVLDGMDEWNTRQHGGSGLTARVRASNVTVAAAEEQTIAFLSRWVEAGVSPMCGNSICQDRRFLAREMPLLERYFHYRNLDVSTLKELPRKCSKGCRRVPRIWRSTISVIRFANWRTTASISCARFDIFEP